MKTKIPDEKNEGLNRAPLSDYVGYRQVAAKLGIARRTLERRVRAGTFPRPTLVSPNRVAWPVDGIAHLLPMPPNSTPTPRGQGDGARKGSAK